MAFDETKWAKPAVSAEVARGILDCRLAMIELYRMIQAVHHGDQAEYDSAEADYFELDAKLRKLVSEIGGLHDPTE